MGDPGAQKVEAGLRLLTVDDVGYLKVIEAPSYDMMAKASVVKRYGEPSKARGYTAAVVGQCGGSLDSVSGSDVVVAAARAGGTIEVRCGEVPEPGGAVLARAADAPSREDARSVGLDILWHNNTPRVASLARYGGIRVHERRGPPGEDGAAEWKETAAWGAGCERAEALTAIAAGGVCHVGAGGEGAELKVWDLARVPGPGSTTAKAEPQFAARPSKPDKTTLLSDKAWVSAAKFVGLECPSLVFTGSGGSYGKYKVRLYDMREKRRPVRELAWGESRITALAPRSDGRAVWMANGAGNASLWDLRAGGEGLSQVRGNLRGLAGSVRSLALHPEGRGLVASVGLDRFLRVHDTGTCKPRTKLYLKQQMSAVCWCPVDAAKAAAALRAAEEAVGAGGGAQQGEDAEGEYEDESDVEVPDEDEVGELESSEDEGDGAAEEEVAEFVACEKFAGRRAGMVFKRGKEGLGYYRDDKPVPTFSLKSVKKGGAVGKAGGKRKVEAGGAGGNKKERRTKQK
ncbi:unnamed protein product [Pedinophyceae sp. YPF-701]|nr:unnamed protein product [Pedinophyceae sp. YPF-701]